MVEHNAKVDLSSTSVEMRNIFGDGGQLISSASDLGVHIHDGGAYPCPVPTCGRTFVLPGQVLAHVSYAHPQSLPDAASKPAVSEDTIVCPLCSAPFESVAAAIIHCSSVHKTELHVPRSRQS